MRHILLFFFSINLSYGLLLGQDLVSTTDMGSRSTTELNIGLLLLGSSLQVDYDVELIAIEYSTMGSNGMPDVASGLLIIPRGYEGDLPIHVHMHGTTTREQVPSTLGGGYELGLFYAAKGHLVIMPDYLGMGSSRGFHPYLHRETQASAGWDMLLAVQSFADSREDITLSDQLSIAGYSQGGHAAMAFQGLVETEYSEVVDLYASTPMSGPYDLSGAFKSFIFSDTEYFFPGYLIYQMVGYNQVYGDIYEDLSDVLKPDYVEPAKSFESSGTELGQLNNDLSELLIRNEGKSVPLLMFKDEIIESFTNDDNFPLNVALLDNDTYNFTSEVPTRLIYCVADDQVPYVNSITADSIMNANQSIDVTSIDVKTDADHGECIVPAVEESIRFIEQFLKTTSTSELDHSSFQINLYPNPTTDVILLDISSEVTLEQVRIYDQQARLVQSYNPYGKSINKILLTELPSGTYVLEIITDQGSAFRKVIKS